MKQKKLHELRNKYFFYFNLLSILLFKSNNQTIYERKIINIS